MENGEDNNKAETMLTKAWSELAEFNTAIQKRLYKNTVELATGFNNAVLAFADLGAPKRASLTEHDDVIQLQNDFIKKYGQEGFEVLGRLAQSHTLNGGKSEEGYKGLKYAIPITFYAMDRALDPNKDSEFLKNAYKQFKSDVKYLARDLDKEYIGVSIPERRDLQNICRPFLKQVRMLHDFTEKYGNEGLEILEKLSQSQALNGEEAEEHQGQKFYATPVKFYAMARALDNSQNHEFLHNTYEQFASDVQHIAIDQKQQEDIEVPIPSQSRLQDICRRYLKEIRDIPPNIAVITNTNDDNDAHIARSEVA
ncbi:MAG: hypothetical protein ACRBDL_08280 [Alphaproteobacteria bacterium]